MRRALKQVGVATGYAVTEGWRLSRVMFTGILLLFVAIALIPAAQIMLLASVTSVSDSRQQLLTLLVCLALLIGAGQVAVSVSTYLAEMFSQEQGLRQQQRFLAAVSRISPRQLARPEVTAEIQAARAEQFTLSQYLYDLIAAVSSIIATMGVCVAVFPINTTAGVLVMAAIVPLLAAASWTSRLVDSTWSRLGEHQRRAEYGVEQLVSQRTGTELAILGTGSRFASMSHTHLKRYTELFRIMRLKTSFADVAAALVTAALLALALMSLAGDSVKGEAIAVGILGVISGMAATSTAGEHLGALVREAPKAARFYTFLQSAPPAEIQPSPSVVAELRADQVRVTYGNTVAVQEVSIQARKGEVVALVGPNGSGKTSLIHALLGVVNVTAGQVLLDQRDAQTMTASERLSYFAHLSQEFGSYEVSIREALLLGVPDREPQDEELWLALDRANISDLVHSWPNGLDTVLGEQWGGLGISGGQWQRIALARVYLRKAPILILDEPTSAIDAESESQIFAELRAGSASRVTVLVTHRAWTLRTVDRIYVMDSGAIVESGTYQELMKSGGRFAEIFAEQLGAA